MTDRPASRRRGLSRPRRRHARSPDRQIRVAGSQSVQIGDHNVQHNTYYVRSPPSRWRGLPTLAVTYACSGLLLLVATYAQLRGATVVPVWIVAAVTFVGSILLTYWTVTADPHEDRTMPFAGRGAAARRHLMEQTNRWWIQGALHKSLQSAVRLEVGLADQPDAVRDPFGSAQLADLLGGAPMPAGTRLRSLFRGDCANRLLVIGEPGSGKTTHLLELAEDQLGLARTGEEAPVPVVLLLSTWARAPGGLASWICAQARQRYTIDAADMMSWLEAGDVLLLLDGLDEVDEAYRADCLADLESFCADPRFHACSLAVTCRTREFRALDRKVSVTAAVRVLPLGAEQVAHALAGDGLAALRAAAADDESLAQLLTTPLMLGVAILAFSRLEPGTRLPTGEPRQALIGLYVQRMLERVRTLRLSADQPGPVPPANPKDTYYHLVWLARLMTRQGQTIFYPDLLTPAWLPDRRPPWPLTRQCGPLSWLARQLGWDHTSTGLVGGRLAALVGAMAGAPLGALAAGVLGAVLAAIVAATVLGAGVALTFGVLFQAALFERLFTPVVGHDTYNIYAASSWSWSWRKAGRGLVTWLLFGGAVGAGIAFAGTPLESSLVVAAVLGVGGILSGGTVPDHEKPPVAPGGALDASLRRLSLLLSVLFAVVLVGSAVLAVMDGPWTAPIAALPITVAFMLTAGPARAWLRHRAAYYGARASRLLPRDLAPLLHRGEDRVLLRRIGGGYMFLHRDLQAYLAQRPPEQPPRSAIVTTAHPRPS